METAKRYENYPISTVLLSNLQSIGIYVLGFFIIHKIGWLYSSIFLLYILLFEFRIVKYHCTKCYYFGKTCGFGKGWISSCLFKKGDVSKFNIKEISWKNMIPDLLVTLIPFITGIVLMIIDFDIIILLAILIIIFLTTAGNGYVRGQLTCNYCKQKDLGCPADKLFNKKD